MKTAVILFLLWCTTTHSAVISPTELVISESRAVASFTVTNDTAEAITYQAQGRSWNQVNGENVEENSNDVIVTPPIVTIAADKKQVFRVGLSKKIESTPELAYRVYLEDVSEITKVKTSNDSGISFRFNHNLPLFINMNKYTAALSLTKCSGFDQIINCIKVKNNGNAHFKVIKVTVTDKDQNTTELAIGSRTAVLSNSWIEYKFKSINAIQNFHVETTTEKVDFIAVDIK